MTTAAHDAALLARLGFRAPARAVRELPDGWSGDLRWARALEALREVADPDAALRRLVALGPHVVDVVVADPASARPLLMVLGFSEYLTDRVARIPGLVDELLGAPAAARDDVRDAKDAALTAIAAADLSSPVTRSSFAWVGRALADLADRCLSRALGPLDAPGSGFAVLAMGKFGGRELNYVSDIDVLFVHEGPHEPAQRTARRLMETMNGPPTVFRTDADLRPEGRDGPLSRTLASFEAYYARWAHVWEFQSLIKCRFAAGDPDLGRAFLELVVPYVWPERLAPEAIEQVRAMKGRVEREVARRGLGGRQLKLGPGGIRDVEFAVQLLQLVHGRHHPELRVPATLDALDLLGAEGFVAPTDASDLAEAYVFLRHAEHRLQLERGRQTHTMPSTPARREHLARALGFRDDPDRTALAAFEEQWRRTMGVVRRIHERLFYRPLLEAFASVPALGRILGPEEARERLAALGFDRPPRAQQAIEALTSGAGRRAKVMRAILPGLLAWLAETPDPDLGLLHLRDVAERLDAFPHLLGVLRDEPPVAELLCRALGTGPVLAGLLERDPSFITALETRGRRAERDSLVREATAVVARAAEPAQSRAALRRFKEAEWLRLAAEDLSAGDDPAVFVRLSGELSDLGDACLEAALVLARSEQDRRSLGPPPGEFAIVGMGRLGGRELNYQSDLDVMFVYDGEGACPDGSEGRLYHTAVAERVTELLGASPPIFKVDAEIRPEGRSGAIVLSLEGFHQYYERRARVWEFQALIRARHAAGDRALTDRLLDAVADRVWPATLDAGAVAEVRRIKARIERERVKANEDPRFQVKLGIGGLADVEFTVQLLQMRHGRSNRSLRSPNTLAAIDELRGLGLVADRDADWLRDAYLMLNRVRNHLFLLRGVGSDALPTRDEDLERLARSLGYGRLSRARFVEDYRRITRRARRVCDRLFYGEEGVVPGGTSD